MFDFGGEFSVLVMHGPTLAKNGVRFMQGLPDHVNMYGVPGVITTVPQWP